MHPGQGQPFAGLWATDWHARASSAVAPSRSAACTQGNVVTPSARPAGVSARALYRPRPFSACSRSRTHTHTSSSSSRELRYSAIRRRATGNHRWTHMPYPITRSAASVRSSLRTTNTGARVVGTARHREWRLRTRSCSRHVIAAVVLCSRCHGQISAIGTYPAQRLCCHRQHGEPHQRPGLRRKQTVA